MEIQPGIDIYLGDCLEVMKGIPDGSVDMVMADLPYGTTECAWDSVIPLAPLWEHYRRLLKATGAVVLTASQPFTTMLITSNLPWFKYCWVWEKTKGTDFMNAKNRPIKLHEDVCVFSPGTTANRSPRRMVYNPQGLIAKQEIWKRPQPRGGGFIGHRPSRKAEYVREWTNYPTSVLHFANPNNDSIHETQKPVPLMEYLVRTYTNEGELVLDNTMGSGTTGIACIRSSRRFVGIEKDPGIFETARTRLAGSETKEVRLGNEVLKQSQLF